MKRPRKMRGISKWHVSNGRITALSVSLDGLIWVGTEEEGLACLDPSMVEVDHWAASSWNGDPSVSALLADSTGLIWVGHRDQGVSVFDRRIWHTFRFPTGPIGDRINSLTESLDGKKVYISTDSGLTIFTHSSNNWMHITRANGLPFLTVSKTIPLGKHLLVILSDCDGGVVGTIVSKRFRRLYRLKHIEGPLKHPRTMLEKGIASNFINDAVISNGEVVIATNEGITFLDTSNGTCETLHGVDLSKIISGSRRPSAQISQGDVMPLAHENVSSITLIGNGTYAIIGYRQGQPQVIDLRTSSRNRAIIESLGPAFLKSGVFTRCALVTNLCCILGTYDNGLWWKAIVRSGEEATNQKPPEPHQFSEIMPLYPAALYAPSPAEVISQTTTSHLINRPAIRIEDDCRTKGNWLGRYGLEYALLGAFHAPESYRWGWACANVKCVASIGDGFQAHDSIRCWIHWPFTDNPNSLEIPPIIARQLEVASGVPQRQLRRQSEYDDHGEAYPMSLEGPDLDFNLTVPPGWHILSIYDYNKDGLDGRNELRDYSVTIRDRPAKKAVTDFVGENNLPIMSSARIRDFRSGIYTRFLLHGPRSIAVIIGRNHSFNTIVSAIILDPLNPIPSPYDQVGGNAALCQNFCGRPQMDDRYKAKLLIQGRLGMMSACKAGSEDLGIRAWIAARTQRFHEFENLIREGDFVTPRRIEKSMYFLNVGARSSDGMEKHFLSLAIRKLNQEFLMVAGIVPQHSLSTIRFINAE